MVKLQDDEIKWILSLDASKTQQEIYKVTQANKALADSNKAVRKEMLDLEAQGKKNSEAWNNLDASYKQNSKSIADNTLRIKEHEKTLGLDNLTMSQLKKSANDLQRQMDQTSKSLAPDQYAKLSTQLQATRARMDELKGKSGEVENSLNKGATNISSFFSAAKSGDIVGMIPMLGKFAGVIGLVAGGLSFAKEAMESTRATSKEFKADLEGLATSWNYLLKSVASGDFTFKGMIAAFEAGKEYKLTLGTIAKEQQSLTVEEAKNFNKIQALLEVQRDVTKSVKERKDAGNEILRITEEEGKLKQDVTSKSYDALMKKMTSLTGLSKVDYETFMENYNKKDFPALEKSANMYNRLKELVKDPGYNPSMLVKGTEFEKTFTNAYNIAFKQIAKGRKEITSDEIWRINTEAINNIFSQNTKLLARTTKAYGKTTKDEIDALVDLQVKSIRVPGEVIQETMRVRRTNHKLEKELTDEEIKKHQEAAKAAQKILDDQKAARDKILEDSNIQLEAETAAYHKKLKEKGLFEKELTDLTTDQLKERERLEEEYYVNISKTAVEAENKRFATTKKDSGVDGDPTKLKGDKLKAYELIVQQHEINLTNIADSANKKRLDSQKETNTAIISVIAMAEQAELASIESVKQAKTHALKTDYINHANGVTSEEIYLKKLAQLDIDSLNDKLQAETKHRDLLKVMNFPPTKENIKALQDSEKAVATTQAQIDDIKLKGVEKFEKEKEKVKKKYSKDSLSEQYAIEKAALDLKYAGEIGQEAAHQYELKQLKLKYALKYTEEAGKIVSAGSNFVTSLQTAETSKIQSDYQKRLSGLNQNDTDYAAKKEKLQHDQSVAELNVQKKYADAQFGIQVAQIGIATATGIMNAWSSAMILGPIAGPIAAGVMTALLVGTGAAEIAAAAAERNKVKSMTIDSTSSSSSSSSSIASGYADGGYTGDGGKYEVAGYVHKKEYVVAQEEMSNPITASYVRKIEAVKQQRSANNPLPTGYSDGGYTGDSNSSILQYASMNGFADKFMEAVNKFSETKLAAEINYWEWKKMEQKVTDSYKLGER